MIHKHHIIPKHAGGSDDPDNIIELTVEEHAQAHLYLYEKYGKKEDLCAYYMLSGKNKDPEFIKLRASIGGKAAYENYLNGGKTVGWYAISPELRREISTKNGKKQGKKNAESGHMSRIQKIAISNGNHCKRSVEVCREKQVNAFFDPELRREISRKGGFVQGKKNAESGHLAKIGKLPRKRVPRMWITNGVDSALIRVEEEIPNGWYKGRVQKKKI